MNDANPQWGDGCNDRIGDEGEVMRLRAEVEALRLANDGQTRLNVTLVMENKELIAEREALRIVAENTVSLLEHLTGRANLSANNYAACERVLMQAREVINAATAAIEEQQ